MKEFMYEDEYKELIDERANFLKIHNILKITPLEIQNNMQKDDIISYFCIVYDNYKTYIIFYSEDGKDLIQILTDNKNKTFFELFDNELLTEVNVDKPQNDGYCHRGYRFNYNEEPYFIKQIIFERKSFSDTDIIKEIDSEINYYKDKVQNKHKEIFDYTEVNNVLNKYKFE